MRKQNELATEHKFDETYKGFCFYVDVVVIFLLFIKKYFCEIKNTQSKFKIKDKSAKIIFQISPRTNALNDSWFEGKLC